MAKITGRGFLRFVARDLESDFKAGRWELLSAGLQAAAKGGLRVSYLGDGLFALQDTKLDP